MDRQEPLGNLHLFCAGLYRKGICTSSVSRRSRANGSSRRIHLQTMRNCGPGTASRVTDISHLKWTDGTWMKRRETWDHKVNPMSIYEVHMGSWMRHPGRDDEGFYTYREFADAIVKYVKDMGYTHIELMGIAEHPFDGFLGLSGDRVLCSDVTLRHAGRLRLSGQRTAPQQYRCDP